MTHIKVRMKYRLKKGQSAKFFECIKTVFSVLERFSDGAELLPFNNNDIGQGIKTSEELKRKKTGIYCGWLSLY